MTILRCKEPFAADLKGVSRVVPAGQLLDSSDPVVKGREHMFEPVDAHMARRNREVEQATAAPGEKRSVTVAGGSTDQDRSPARKGRGKAKSAGREES